MQTCQSSIYVPKLSGYLQDNLCLKILNKKRKEATATDTRNYAQQFEQAKTEEYKSWIGHDVFDLVDIRRLSKHERRNLVSGRWDLTNKRDRDGNFLNCKARWVLRGFQDK